MMARKPIQNLQGFGQTSASAATPVDAFTGAPAIPRVTPASQLADSLGLLSKGFAQAVAKQKQEKEVLDTKKATAYATSFKGF